MMKSKRVCGILLVLSLFFLVFGGIFTLHKNEPQEASAASATAEIKLNYTPLDFINNSSIALDVAHLPFRISEDWDFLTGIHDGLDMASQGGGWRVNNKVPGLSGMNAPLLEFKGSLPTQNSSTNFLKWETQSKTSGVTGPYRVQAMISVISYNGKNYLPYFLFASEDIFQQYGNFFAAGLLEVQMGQTINVTSFLRSINDYFILFLPLGNSILKDDAGRIYIVSGFDKTTPYYFTFSNGKAGFTTNANDSGIVKTESKVPEEQEQTLEQWTNEKYNAHGTYDGETNQCPVQDNDYWTVTGDTSTEAGRHTALVTPKNGMTWSDGTTEGKIITWTVGKANQPDTLAVTGGENVKYGDKPTLTVDGVEGGAKVTWSVEPSNLADIDPQTGELTPKGVGEVTVTATVGEINNYNGTSVTQKSHD